MGKCILILMMMLHVEKKWGMKHVSVLKDVCKILED